FSYPTEQENQTPCCCCCCCCCLISRSMADSTAGSAPWAGAAVRVTVRAGAVCRSPASTQVSFDPPPWLELTTSDPSGSATRVKPPGSTHTSSPSLTANGRRSTCRGATSSPISVG